MVTIINKVSCIKHGELMSDWCDKKEVPKKIFLSHAKIDGKDVWVCSDNRNGDMWTDVFSTIEEAHAWAKGVRSNGRD